MKSVFVVAATIVLYNMACDQGFAQFVTEQPKSGSIESIRYTVTRYVLNTLLKPGMTKTQVEKVIGNPDSCGLDLMGGAALKANWKTRAYYQAFLTYAVYDGYGKLEDLEIGYMLPACKPQRTR